MGTRGMGAVCRRRQGQRGGWGRGEWGRCAGGGRDNGEDGNAGTGGPLGLGAGNTGREREIDFIQAFPGETAEERWGTPAKIQSLRGKRAPSCLSLAVTCRRWADPLAGRRQGARHLIARVSPDLRSCAPTNRVRKRRFLCKRPTTARQALTIFCPPFLAGDSYEQSMSAALGSVAARQGARLPQATTQRRRAPAAAPRCSAGKACFACGCVLAFGKNTVTAHLYSLQGRRNPHLPRRPAAAACCWERRRWRRRAVPTCARRQRCLASRRCGATLGVQAGGLYIPFACCAVPQQGGRACCTTTL